MKMGHVTELLSAYLDEQVSSGERARITTHLEACESCRAHLELLRKTVALLHTTEPVRAPEGFRARLRERIDAQPRRAPRTFGLPRLPWSWRTAAAALAVVMVGLFTVNLLRAQFPRVALQRARGPEVSVSTPPPPFPGPPAASVDRAARAPEVGAPAPYTPGEPALRRVPAPRFADVLAQVEELGHVQQRRISGQDVTEEYVDLQARIRNLERYEQRLLAFADRAAKVSDLLAIEQELARVRGEIEMLTGRARYLDRQVDLASIQVSAHEQAKASGGFWDFSGTLTKVQMAFLATIRQLLRAAEAVVVAVSALVPVAVRAGLAWFVVRRVRVARGI